MADTRDLMPLSPNREALVEALSRCNDLSARYGLVLSEDERAMLAARQETALRETGRVEFGRGPYEKLVYAFCDSPYLSPASYAETLAALCELFYHFKGESGERWSDDELIAAMAELFGGSCHGAVELVADRLWQSLHNGSDEHAPEEDDDLDEGEPFAQ